MAASRVRARLPSLLGRPLPSKLFLPNRFPRFARAHAAKNRGFDAPGPMAGLSSVALAMVMTLGVPLGIPGVSHALLSNPNAGMARSATAALRRAVPVMNDKLGTVQTELERAQYLLRFPNRKPWGQMNSIANQVLVQIEANRDGVLQGVPDEKKEEAEAIIKKITENIDGMQVALVGQDSDKTATYLARALLATSDLEMLEMPSLPYTLPARYASLPYLQGRATVQMTFEGINDPLNVIIDGYSAPLTCGNFLKNLQEGVYKGSKVSISDKTTVFVRPSNTPSTPSLPLEVRLKDELRPEYRQPLDITNGDYPALPLSIYGAVAMAHGSEDTLNAPAEFFIYKFDRASMGGLGGLSFEEGQFSVFGYVTEDSQGVLEAITDGAQVSDTNVVTGSEKLIQAPGTAEIVGPE